MPPIQTPRVKGRAPRCALCTWVMDVTPGGAAVCTNCDYGCEIETHAYRKKKAS